jgi:hypothetical protein
MRLSTLCGLHRDTEQPWWGLLSFVLGMSQCNNQGSWRKKIWLVDVLSCIGISHLSGKKEELQSWWLVGIYDSLKIWTDTTQNGHAQKYYNYILWKVCFEEILFWVKLRGSTCLWWSFYVYDFQATNRSARGGLLTESPSCFLLVSRKLYATCRMAMNFFYSYPNKVKP